MPSKVVAKNKFLKIREYALEAEITAILLHRAHLN